MDDQRAQQLYLEYRALAEQSKQIQQYLQQTADGLIEITAIIDALESLSHLAKGDRLFAPIANGIFIDATLNDPGHVRMNVGSGVVVQKTIPEAKALLEQQRKELEQLRDRATADAGELAVRMRGIEEQMEAAETAHDKQCGGDCGHDHAGHEEHDDCACGNGDRCCKKSGSVKTKTAAKRR